MENASSDLQIVQIMPAQGWFAVFTHRSEGGQVHAEKVLLTGWALVEEAAGERSVQGLCAGTRVWLCEGNENFLGYSDNDHNESVWLDKAVKHLGS